MGLYQPATDPNQAILERLNTLERKVAEWQNGQIVCHPNEKRMRLLVGLVNTTTPSPTSGPGWTCTKIGTGQLRVVFTTPFSAAPKVYLTAFTDNVAWRAADTFNALPTISQADIGMASVDNQIQDGNISFLIIGPV